MTRRDGLQVKAFLDILQNKKVHPTSETKGKVEPVLILK